MTKRKPPEKRKEPGRPSLFREDEHCRVARQETGNGRTLAQIAELFGINRSTVVDWMTEHPTFAAAVRLGREDATDKVEAALFQRATGYVQPTEKLLVVSGGQGMGSCVERHDTAEHIPADVGAARYWLANRRAHEWRERQEVKHEGKLTLEQLLAESTKPATTEPATTGEKP